MEMNFNQISSLSDTLNSLKDKTLPFKLSLIIAKDLAILQKEFEFYIDQERQFANTYLQTDENGKFIQESEGVFKIKDGMEDECRTAREDLDNFTTDIELRKIPIKLIENMELTPSQVGALELIIEEE